MSCGLIIWITAGMMAAGLVIVPRLFLGVSIVFLAGVAPPLAARQTPTPFTIVTPETRRPLATRTLNGVEVVALDQLAPAFGLTLREDTLAGSMNVTAGRQVIVLTTGQPAASVAGRVYSLSSPVTRDGRAWLVPLDFLSRVLGPALGTRIEVRSVSRLVLVGEVRWPQVGVRLERIGAGVRITADIQPPTTFQLAREGARVIAKFEAAAIEFTLGGASAPDLVSSVRAEGTSVMIDLGPAASLVRPTEDSAGSRFTVDIAPATGAGPVTPGTPTIDLAGGLRTIAIDAGHGGEETGAKAAGGQSEKDVTLNIARRLKAAIEARIGARVVMTRDGDDTVPLDRRTAIVNNNQADVLISLHADAAFVPGVRGARVLTLFADDYKRSGPQSKHPPITVAIAGGGTRTLDVVPWEFAQLPKLPASQAFAASVEQRLREQQVPLHPRALDALPLRLLAGANMPAILIEAGFLSNPADAAALAGETVPNAIVEALIAALTDLRDTLAARGPRR
jgi:N-acetylmuramoyl-L-alanine amidase